MSKRILTVGLQLASDAAYNEDFDSKVSLLDWDIVLFRPVIDDVIEHDEEYKGKPWLTDTSSFELRESCQHWQREIKLAVDHGKTVIVFLPPITEVYIATGRERFEGKRLIKDLELCTNYSALPLSLNPVNARGTSMKLAPDAEILASYWSEFGSISAYEVVLGSHTASCITTKSGGKTVGAILRSVDSTAANFRRRTSLPVSLRV
jgi:hypothetical protein